MAGCEPQLYQILKSIEPTRTQRDGAQRSHNFLRDVLCTGNMASRIRTSYLSGSYARDTVIYPLDDVDIIFVIEPSQWSNWWSDPEPEAVLKSFERAIRYRYDGSSLCIQRRSVRLQLNHLDIDVVPAIDCGGELIKIPDRADGGWITSGPKRHSAIAAAVNQIRAGKFKPVIKLLKSWNSRLPSTACLKSFAIETIATRLFKSEDFGTLDEGLFLFFDFLVYCKGGTTVFDWDDKYGMRFSQWFGVSVPDTAETGSNVAARVDWGRAEKFLNHAERSRNKMQEAEDAARQETAFRRVCDALRID